MLKILSLVVVLLSVPAVSGEHGDGRLIDELVARLHDGPPASPAAVDWVERRWARAIPPIPPPANKKIDPITKVKEIILDKKYASEEEIKEIDNRVKERVKECEKFAEESPFPPKEQLYDVVYEQEDYPFLEHKL